MLRNSKKSRIVLILCSVAAALLLWYFFSLPRNLFDVPFSAILESSDGTLLGARTAADGQWRFPPSDSVPEKFAKSLITYEDKRFYRHPGVDFLAIGNAIKNNISPSSHRRGASTITMQTIRLSRPSKKRDIGTKITEAILATRLELRCKKDEILLLYASNAPFGGNVVGLEGASWRYFGRPAAELSWAESAMLAILPNSPSLVHPGKNRGILLKKRNNLLDRLCAAGEIDSLDCSLAKEEPLPEKPYPMPNIAPHYLETLRLKGGGRLYRTGISLDLQKQVEAILLRQSELFRSNKVENIAAVVLSTATGEPLAYCGNAPGAPGSEVDVVQAPRSSGSTLKPFLYGAMLDEGSILPTMLVSDIPFHYKNFSPRNYNNSFDGAVPAWSVIQRSLNVPSVRMLDDFGVDKFILLLEELGFTTITRGADTYGLSLILGGAEITLWDLAKAYCGAAAQLKKYPVEGTPENAPLSSGAIWCTFEALSEVNRPEEEGLWKAFSSTRRVAWKTGTSYGNRDAWSIGATPEYIVAVWVGNCTGEGRPKLTGVGYAAPVMFDIFSLLPGTGWFDMPEGELEEVAVCHESGHPFSSRCSQADTVWAPIAPQRPDLCPYHRIIHLSEDGRHIVDSDCYSVSKMKTASWFVLPPAQEWYYMKRHSSYRPLPPYHPMMASEASSKLEIIYPQNGMRVAAPVALDSKSRGVVFSAVHSDPDVILYWHIDSAYIGSTSKGEHKIPIVPVHGKHTLTIISSDGGKASVTFYGE